MTTYDTFTRRYGRVNFLCRVSLLAGPGHATIEVSSTDISLGGVCLISPSYVAPGHPVTLTFHLKSASQVAVDEPIHGQLVSARSDIDGHRLGVEFDEPLERSRNPELARRVEKL